MATISDVVNPQTEKEQDFSPAPNTILLALALAIVLGAARVLAITTNHSSEFWLAWSAMVGLISFLSPISGVTISIANVFLSLEDASPLGFSTGQIAGVAAGSRLILQLSIRHVVLYRVWRPSHAAVAGVAIIMLLSAFFSEYHALPYRPLIKLIMIFVLYVLILVYVDSFDRLLFFQAGIVFSAAAAGIMTIYDPQSAEAAVGRATGLIGNPNYQGIYLAVATPLAFSLLIYTKATFWRFLALVSVIVNILGIVATASRGGVLVLGISFVLMGMVWGRGGKRVRVLLGILLIAFVLALSSNDVFVDRYTATVDLIERDIRSQSRIQLAEYSLNLWLQYPMLGVGAGNWLSGVQQQFGITYTISPHVWPAQILAELGTLGFLFYLTFVYFCIKDYAAFINSPQDQYRKHVDLFKGFFVSAMTMSLAWTSGNPYNQLWFTLLLMGGVALFMLQRNTEVSTWQID